MEQRPGRPRRPPVPCTQYDTGSSRYGWLWQSPRQYREEKLMIDRNALNVLMITPRYFPHMGGIETHVHEVGRRLTRNGINVTLLTTEPENRAHPLPREAEVEGCASFASGHGLRSVTTTSRRRYILWSSVGSGISSIVRGATPLFHPWGCWRLARLGPRILLPFIRGG